MRLRCSQGLVTCDVRAAGGRRRQPPALGPRQAPFPCTWRPTDLVNAVREEAERADGGPHHRSLRPLRRMPVDERDLRQQRPLSCVHGRGAIRDGCPRRGDALRRLCGEAQRSRAAPCSVLDNAGHLDADVDEDDGEER